MRGCRQINNVFTDSFLLRITDEALAFSTCRKFTTRRVQGTHVAWVIHGYIVTSASFDNVRNDLARVFVLAVRAIAFIGFAAIAVAFTCPGVVVDSRLVVEPLDHRIYVATLCLLLVHDLKQRKMPP
eukprot:COSAG04_NODE_5828_length_1483_cov_0.845376_1_plen_126_part_10